MNQISIPSSELKLALSGLSKIVNRKSSLPVLQTIRLARDVEGRVSLTATDLDSFVTYTTEHPQPGQPVDVLLPFEQLNKMVKGCGGEVVVSPEPKDKAKIKYQLGDSSLEQSVNTISVKEFPPSPKITEKVVPMPVQFGETLRQAFDTSSSDSSRYVLQGAYLDVEQSKCHSIVSTNGRALFAANTFTFGLKESVNIAKNKFLAWSGFLEGECGLTVQPNKQNGGYVQFATPRWNCISKQIEGKFPNWRQVVPNDTEVWTKVILNEAATTQILALSNKLPGNDEPNHTLQLRIGKDLYLEGKGKDDKEFTSALISGVNITGKHITTALNREYLQSALRCGLNEIRVSSELEPLVFCSVGKKMVVMPVRLQGPVTTQEKPAKPESTPAKESATSTTTTEPERNTDMAKDTKTEPVKTIETTTLIDQIEQIREVMKNTVRDLGNLIDAVKLAEKEKRASEKEVEAARSVLKKLQQVTI